MANQQLTPELEREFERMMAMSQAKEMVRFYNGLTERCFHGCVNEFTGRSLNPKEELCVYK